MHILQLSLSQMKRMATDGTLIPYMYAMKGGKVFFDLIHLSQSAYL